MFVRVSQGFNTLTAATFGACLSCVNYVDPIEDVLDDLDLDEDSDVIPEDHNYKPAVPPVDDKNSISPLYDRRGDSRVRQNTAPVSPLREPPSVGQDEETPREREIGSNLRASGWNKKTRRYPPRKKRRDSKDDAIRMYTNQDGVLIEGIQTGKHSNRKTSSHKKTAAAKR
eukprot:Filipodium_phascolosomae@DN2133_c0_g1_i2.p1